MRTTLGALLGILLLLSGCQSQGDFHGTAWTKPETNVALQRCAYVSGSYCPSICPFAPDYFVFRKGHGKIQTFEELQGVLEPIDSKEKALAYREMLAEVKLERDENLKTMQWCHPLAFDEGEKASFLSYTQMEAERWGIGRGPVVDGRDPATKAVCAGLGRVGPCTSR